MQLSLLSFNHKKKCVNQQFKYNLKEGKTTTRWTAGEAKLRKLLPDTLACVKSCFLPSLPLGPSDTLAKELVWFDKNFEEFLEKLPEAELNLCFKPLPSGLLTEALAPKKEAAELS